MSLLIPRVEAINHHQSYLLESSDSDDDGDRVHKRDRRDLWRYERRRHEEASLSLSGGVKTCRRIAGDGGQVWKEKKAKLLPKLINLSKRDQRSSPKLASEERRHASVQSEHRSRQSSKKASGYKCRSIRDPYKKKGSKNNARMIELAQAAISIRRFKAERDIELTVRERQSRCEGDQ